jgi:hypothetical protein
MQVYQVKVRRPIQGTIITLDSDGAAHDRIIHVPKGTYQASRFLRSTILHVKRSADTHINIFIDNVRALVCTRAVEVMAVDWRDGNTKRRSVRGTAG